MNALAKYEALDAELQAIADRHFTHRRHMCERILEYDQATQDQAIKLLNQQVWLLVKIVREKPLPYHGVTK